MPRAKVGARETDIKHAIRLRLGPMPDVLLYNNPVGVLTTDRMRTFRYGLCVGSSDLVGLGPGGRFLALEVKTATGKPTQPQLQFIELVNRMGGVGAIVRSPDEAAAVVDRMRSESNENR